MHIFVLCCHFGEIKFIYNAVSCSTIITKCVCVVADQTVDIKKLVMAIWNGKSLLSENSNLLNLVLVRWDKYEQWSPWNTILLTRDEAEAHDRLEDVTQVSHQ